MADIAQLAANARSIKARSDQSVGWKLAAIKAVEASGTRHPPDVARISQQVYDLLRRSNTRRSERRRRA